MTEFGHVLRFDKRAIVQGQNNRCRSGQDLTQSHFK
jgi:hypothetical protein